MYRQKIKNRNKSGSISIPNFDYILDCSYIKIQENMPLDY